MGEKNHKCPIKRKNGNVNERQDSKTHHWVKMANGKALWVPKGTDPGIQPHKQWIYNQVTCDHVCDSLVEGETMMDIGKQKGMPNTRMLYRWMASYPEFRKAVKEAKKLRAEYYHDKVIDTADKTTSAKSKGDRVKISAYKWAAETGSPEEFGTKRREETKDPIVMIHIDTGIKRPDIETAIEVDGTVIEDKDGT